MKVNPNSIQAEFILEHFLANKIHQVVISPGSRSTSLALAFATHKKFTVFPVVDERTAAFFATGIARTSQKPVVLVCTSGTAVAEYYPAIVEAFQQRIPLVVCTADRPEHLVGTGANQTIHQRDIYQNHIRFAFDAGLPLLQVNYYKRLQKNLVTAIRICTAQNPGPVHINLPYDKPFEPDTVTHTMPNGLRKFLQEKAGKIKTPITVNSKQKVTAAIQLLQNSKRVLILAGPGMYPVSERRAIIKMSKKFSAPVLTDIGSGLRFVKIHSANFISSYDSILRAGKDKDLLQPDVIIVFGLGMVSAALHGFLDSVKVPRIIINNNGDRIDPTDNQRVILSGSADNAADWFATTDINPDKTFLQTWLFLAKQAQSVQGNIVPAGHLHDAGIAASIGNLLPDKSTVMLANSLTYRVFDDFTPVGPKELTLFQNRGASGIDGLIATSAGIAAITSTPVYLFIGDVTFYYDLNALLLLRFAKVPVTIYLFDNGGGRIFDVLPVKRYMPVASEIFRTPVNYNIQKVVEAFNGKYIRVTNFGELHHAENIQSGSFSFRVIHLIIDAEYAQSKRNELRSAHSLGKP